MNKKISFLKSLKFAIEGIHSTARTERNFRVHIFIAIFTVMTCIIFRVDTIHFVFVLTAIFAVLITELINTAVERIVDLLTAKRHHPLAKLAKDAAAGAVLLASVFAVLIGVLTAWSVIRRFI